jgi:hypothetical protein
MKEDQRSTLAYAKGVCVEIGTWEGGFSGALLDNPAVTRLYCIDPYKHFDNEEYPDGMNSLSQGQFDELFRRTWSKLTAKYGSDRVVFIRKTSADAVKDFTDETLDFVYVDGNHDYKYVLEDLHMWYPKIKPGGFLCGDDVYSRKLSDHDENGNVKRVWSPGCWGMYGTYKAIVDFGKPYGLNETQFFIQK